MEEKNWENNQMLWKLGNKSFIPLRWGKKLEEIYNKLRKKQMLFMSFVKNGKKSWEQMLLQ
jgi:hypothetical protein